MTGVNPRLALFGGYGIELEYMIVDEQHANVLPVTDAVIKHRAGEYVNEVEDGAVAWSNELVLHVIELKSNGPAPSLTSLPAQFTAAVRTINHILAGHGGRLMPTGMHPWMDPYRETRLWPHEANEIYDSYNRIFNCQGHGWSNLQSMHINLPFADEQEFARLHAGIRALLPLMPALAASSPIMDGDFTGLMDTRLETYRRNAESIPQITGLVIPEPVTGIREYEEIIFKPMYAAIAPHDPQGILQHEWLNSRGAITRFDRYAIEIRVLDVQETPKADIAVAAFLISILKKLVTPVWSDMQQQNGVTTDLLSELFLHCVRDAEQAVVREREYLELFGFPDRHASLQELLLYLLESVAADDTDLDPELRQVISFNLTNGPLARRICRAVGNSVRQSRLKAVYERLCQCLPEGELFAGID